MKNLVRGGVLLILTSLFVAFIYAQTKTEDTLDIANDSQTIIENNISGSNLISSNLDQNITAEVSGTPEKVEKAEVTAEKSDDVANSNKLVKKTASVKAVTSGASKGKFSATAYCLSGRTAMGHGVRRGIIAADPRVLKLGSTVTISAGPWSGTYLVSDTGGKIKGKRVDIWVPSCKEARRFGRRSVQVFQ
jgi:3D (Asp-Asp-Asp) domain-containing protein